MLGNAERHDGAQTLEQVIAEAVAAEREACAEIADAYATLMDNMSGVQDFKMSDAFRASARAAKDVAEKIRERKL